MADDAGAQAQQAETDHASQASRFTQLLEEAGLNLEGLRHLGIEEASPDALGVLDGQDTPGQPSESWVDRIEARGDNAPSWADYVEDRYSFRPPKADLGQEMAQDNDEPGQALAQESPAPESEPTAYEPTAEDWADYGEYLSEQETLYQAQMEESPDFYAAQEEARHQAYLGGQGAEGPDTALTEAEQQALAALVAEYGPTPNQESQPQQQPQKTQQVQPPAQGR